MKSDLTFTKETGKGAVAIACPHCKTPLKIELNVEWMKGEPEPALELPSSEALSLNPNKVIAAIDGEGTREYIKELLEESRFEVIAVSSLEELFSALARTRPRTVLLDLGLSNRTNIPIREAVQKSLSGSRSTLIFVSAGYGKNDYSAAVLPERGADDYIERRRIQSDLIPKIRLLLERSKQVNGIIEEKPPVLESAFREAVAPEPEVSAGASVEMGEAVVLASFPVEEIRPEEMKEDLIEETIEPEPAESSVEGISSIEAAETEVEVAEPKIESFVTERAEGEFLGEKVEPQEKIPEPEAILFASGETAEEIAVVEPEIESTLPEEEMESESFVEKVEEGAELSLLEAQAWGSVETGEPEREVTDQAVGLGETEETEPETAVSDMTDVETLETTAEIAESAIASLESERAAAIEVTTEPPVFEAAEPEAISAEPIVAIDVKELEAAKRLARIIVSDIVLYNENKVSEGIRNNTLYALLNDEIEEGRNHYNSRVSEIIRKQGDYLIDAFEDFIKKRKAAANLI